MEINNKGKIHKLKGFLTNASTYVGARELEGLGIFSIGKVYRGKDETLKMRIGKSPAGKTTPLMLIDGVGYVSIRFLGELGYKISYGHHEKVIRCVKRT